MSSSDLHALTLVRRCRCIPLVVAVPLGWFAVWIALSELLQGAFNQGSLTSLAGAAMVCMASIPASWPPMLKYARRQEAAWTLASSRDYIDVESRLIVGRRAVVRNRSDTRSLERCKAHRQAALWAYALRVLGVPESIVARVRGLVSSFGRRPPVFDIDYMPGIVRPTVR